MKRLPALLATFLRLMLGTAPVHAQRGMGQASGLAAQGYQADILTVEGTITAILTEPCAQTTGRSIIGLHLIIEETLQGALNLHLGPADDLLSMQRSLEVGDRLEAHVFRKIGRASCRERESITGDGRQPERKHNERQDR